MIPRPRDDIDDAITDLVPRVFRFALRLSKSHHEAEEIVQETFVRAWRRKGRLHDPAAMRTWVFKIAVNVFRDRCRLRARRPTVSLANETAREPASQHRRSVAREDVEWAIKELDALPGRQRQVLYLSAIESLTHGQIADVLRLNIAAVKANLSVARKKMREKLAQRDAMSEGNV